MRCEAVYSDRQDKRLTQRKRRGGWALSARFGGRLGATRPTACKS